MPLNPPLLVPDTDRAKFIQELAAELHKNPADTLTDDERRWIRMAILKEAQSYEFRRTIIEKTLTALVWAALVGLGYLILDFVKNHGGR